MRCPALVLLVLAAGCQTDDPPPEASSGPPGLPSPWRADPVPAACRPELLNGGLPLRWEEGAVHILAWATVADDYWESSTTRAVVLKRFDRPTGDGGHRWVLALLYHHPKDADRPWDGPRRQFAPPPRGQPAPRLTDARRWGYEFYTDRPADEQVATFLRQAGWDPDPGTKETMLSNATTVTVTRTLTAGGVDAAAWRRVFDRDVPPGLFPELRKTDPKK